MAPAPSRRPLLLGALVCAAAAAVRLGHFLALRDFPLFKWPTGDTGDYFRDALAVAAGRLLASPHVFFHSSPIYSYFLAPFAALSPAVAGGDLAAAAAVQLLISAATTLLVFLLGRRLLGDWGGLAAGLLWAFSPQAVFYDGELLGDFLIPPAIAAAALLLTAERVSWRRAAAAGACLGVAALARANILLLLAPAAAVVWFDGGKATRKSRAAVVGALALAAALAVLPCAVRNYVVGRDVVPITANGGVNFWIGNNARANGTFKAPADWVTHLENKSRAYAEAKEGRPLKPSAASAYFTREALRFIFNQPGDFLRQVGRRARLLFNSYEIPNHGDFYFFRARPGILKYLPFTWGIVFPWALVGAVALGRERRFRPVLWFAAVYLISIVVLFFITGRYRFPVYPLLAVMAAAAAIRGWRWLKEGPRWKAAAAAALLAGGYVAAYLPPPPDVVVPASYSWHHLGEAYANHGDDRGAIRAYGRAVELAPEDAYSWNNMGLAHLRRGDPAAAREALARAAELAPVNADILNNNASACLVAGDIAAARAYSDRAYRLAPGNVAVLNNRAIVMVYEGDLGGAEATLRAALDLDPAFSRTWFNLGIVAEARGDRAAALEYYRKGLTFEPANATARAKVEALQ